MSLLSNAQKLADTLPSHCGDLHRPDYVDISTSFGETSLTAACWLLVVTFACKIPQWWPNAASSMLISCASVHAQQMDHHHDSKVGTLFPAHGDLFIVHEILAASECCSELT